MALVMLFQDMAALALRFKGYSMSSKKPKRLGRGLDSLLGDDISLLDELGAPAASGAGVQSINVSLIEAGVYQPRSHIDKEGLQDLVVSIKEQGIIQPILVRLKKTDRKIKRYEIIAGERRFRAAQMAGLKEVPAIIRDVDDQRAAIMALIENIQREDLNPLEEARGIQRLIDEFGLTHQEAATAVGRSRSATTNLLRLLNLTEPVQRLVAEGRLEMGHARALLGVEGAEQLLLADHIVHHGLSVRAAEQLVANHKTEAEHQPKSRAKQNKSGDVLRFENKLSDYLGTKVSLKLGARDRGQLVIQFQDWDHLYSLLEKQGLAPLFDEEAEE